MKGSRTILALSAAALTLGLSGCVTRVAGTPAVVTPDGTVVVPAWSTVAVTTAPPAPVAETQGTAPYADAVWIPGYYVYSNGNYSWVPGKWDRARSGYTWVPAAWEQRADGWYYREGYWAR